EEQALLVRVARVVDDELGAGAGAPGLGDLAAGPVEAGEQRGPLRRADQDGVARGHASEIPDDPGHPGRVATGVAQLDPTLAAVIGPDQDRDAAERWLGGRGPGLGRPDDGRGQEGQGEASVDEAAWRHRDHSLGRTKSCCSSPAGNESGVVAGARPVATARAAAATTATSNRDVPVTKTKRSKPGASSSS